MKTRFANPYSLATIFALFLLLLQLRLWVPNFDTHNVTAILTWDALGYYLYLPDWDGRAGTVSLSGSNWLAVDQSRLAYLLNDRDARPEQSSLRSNSLCSRWLDERR